MTLIRALAAAGLGIQVVAALPSPVHHVGVDITLVPDLDAPIGEARDAADRISIMGPVGLSAVDLGIIGSKGAYQATMLNIGDQGITVDFKPRSTKTQEPIRKIISPLLDGFCSANTNSEPCAKKTSEIEIEASRAVHGNHEVTIFTLKLSRLDNKSVEPPMVAQFAFDGAETGSLIFLTDVPAPPPHYMPPIPPPCDTILCRVGEFLERLNPFASEDEFSGPGDRHHDYYSHHGPHGMGGPHMHDGHPGSPGLGMRPSSYGMHHGPKPQVHEGYHHHNDYNHGPEGASRLDGEFPPKDDDFHPPPSFDGEPPKNDSHHHHPHPHPPHGRPPHGRPPHGRPPHGHPPHGPHHGPRPNGTEPFLPPPYHDEPPKDGDFPPPGAVHDFRHGPHHHGPHYGLPFPLILVNVIFSILGFLVFIKYAANQITAYVHERRRSGLLLESHLESVTPQFPNDTKETSNLLADQAPPPVYREKEPNVDEN